ncbi:SDR family NAD(P)-dependent oxidoreductase [Lentzea sp. CA-135723]|uniref:SDR family NAD(P)-dependent oxidoreductase n=1 Tax=Lentzea sp. CA-135723 TaxID=3239950 RepID=UPI003D8F1A7F
MGLFEGKTAVVTGGSSGIGLATARRLADEGAHVFITGRREKELDAALKVVGNATAVPGDVADAADLDRLYDAVRARAKGVDVLFANTGIGGFATLAETTEEHFERLFGINVRGTLFTVQKALPFLNEGSSVIVNCSVRADDGLMEFGTYSATKAALRSYVRTWANELKSRGVRVNAISPGTIHTPAVAGMDDDVRAGFAARVPIGRMGTADEVAGTVLFLASSQSSFITGSNIHVDGGEKQL